MSALADRDQRLCALDPRRSFIVRAPAGSGKTGLLIQRFLALLAHVEEPEEVVAITFTIKAADEMRSRLLAALRRTAEATDEFERETEALASAARQRDHDRGWQLGSQPGRLRILTIDALCLHLVRQMVWVSETGGDLRPVDDATELYARAARNVFATLDETSSAWADAIETVLALLDNNVPRFETLLVSMLARRDQWLRHVVAIDAEPGERRRHLEAALERAVRGELRALEQLLGSDGKAAIEQLCQGMGVLQAGAAWPGDPAAALGIWRQIAGALLTAKGQARKRSPAGQGFADDVVSRSTAAALAARLADNDELRSRLHAVRRVPEPRYGDAQWARLEALATVLKLAVAELWLVFRDSGRVDFIELVNRAKAALGESERPTDLALALDYRIRHLLVDEFQDTSSTQIELLERLTAGWQRDDGRSLLLVGDPMQSIYRFREADVGLYLGVRDHGLGQLALESLTLETNFRARPEIVAWVNGVFPSMLPDTDEVSAGAVAYSASVARREPDSEAHAVVHCLIDDDGAEEARLVTSLVARARARAVRPSIAILVRARTHLEHILPGLRAAGVSFRGVELDPLRAMPVVQDLLALTRALAYPADRIAWLAILRAPWCGLTLADLTELAGAPRGALILDALADECVSFADMSADGRRRAGLVRDVMLGAFAYRGRCSWRGLVEQTWLALGGPALVDEQALTDAGSYLVLLEHSDTGLETIDLDRLQRLVEARHCSPVAGEADVEIMTLHNAKGLEFDHVIVPGLEREPRSERKHVIEWSTRTEAGGAQDLLVAPIAAIGEPSEPLYDYLRELEARKTRNESARLLYVASTRAREQLHLIGTAKRSSDGLAPPKQSSLLARLWPRVERDFERALAASTPPADEPIEWASSDEQRGGLVRRTPSGWASPVVPVYLAAPPRAKPLEAIEFDWAGASARHVGTVVHQMLCLMSGQGEQAWSVKSIDRRRPRWKAVLAGLGVAGTELERASATVADALTRVIEDPRGCWLLQARHLEARSELALSGLLDGEPINVIVDRTFVDERGVRWIVDYKTGIHSGGDLDAFLNREQLRYAPQLERYARLMAGLDDRRVRLGLYFPLHRGWREWAPGEPAPHSFAGQGGYTVATNPHKLQTQRPFPETNPDS